MSLAVDLNQTVSIWRLAVTSGSKKQVSQVGTTKILIMPMSATAADVNKMAFARAYTGYVMATANVEIGDYLQDASGNKYDVQGARDWNVGNEAFYELTLQKQTQQGQI